MEHEKRDDNPRLSEMLGQIDKKLDNLEELLKLLLVQDVMWDVLEDIAGLVKEAEVYIQYRGLEIELKNLIDRAKTQFLTETEFTVPMETMQIYIKPEDQAAYYVVNHQYHGTISL